MSSSTLLSEFLAQTPRSISVIDCTGLTRRFKVEGTERDGIGFTLYAMEERDVEHGYQLKAHSYSSPHDAFAQLMSRLREALSVRYMEPIAAPEAPSLLAHRAEGRIASGGVVVDGTFIAWADFVRMASAYEGWEFKIEFMS
jgi:hypothetical protein